MTMPRSLTSSRYTGELARRLLERTSVVSIITSWPIHASGIGPPCGAAGLSLSIMVHSPPACTPGPGHLARPEPALRSLAPRVRIPSPTRDRVNFREPPRGEVLGPPFHALGWMARAIPL